MFYPTHGTYRLTPQRNMAVPPFAGRVMAQESVIVTLYLQPENVFVSSFVLSLSILLQHVTGQNE
jgi:hypothetical protein